MTLELDTLGFRLASIACSSARLGGCLVLYCSMYSSDTTDARLTKPLIAVGSPLGLTTARAAARVTSVLVW